MQFIRLNYSILYLERTGLNRHAELFEPYGHADTRSVLDQVRAVRVNHTAGTVPVSVSVA